MFRILNSRRWRGLVMWLFLFLFGMGSVVANATAEEMGSLWTQVSLYRDEWGTPHIYAENIPALGFAFGYAQAEDHILDMLLGYRVANGRAAEVLGEFYAASDEFSLRLGHARLAAEVFPNLDPLTRDLCTGFSMGVNAWLASHPDKCPPWAEGVRPEDILALVHCYLMSQAPFDLPGRYHRAPLTASGNAWAIGPTRSENGQPILVINPHASFEGPFRWYEAHLVCGDLNIAGATLFGVPVIMQGHNTKLGWALTPNEPDSADMYLDAPSQIKSRAPNSVGGNPQRILEENMLDIVLMSNAQKYFVQTAGGVEPRTVPVADTQQGPFMGFEGGKACLWKAGGYRDFGAIAQWVAMGRAQNLQAFQEALAMQQLPCFHVVYADSEGNIFYRYNVTTGNRKGFYEGRPVVRKGIIREGEPETPEKPPVIPIDWAHPLASNDPQYAWGAIIPSDKLPTLINPDSGYVQACGTPPWGVTDNSGMTAEMFPAWFARDFDSYRAQRIRRLLATGKRSFRDCQSMLYDAVVPAAATAVPQLIALAKEHADRLESLQPDLPTAMEILQRWNMAADIKSTGMTFFHAWWTALRQQDPEGLRTDQALYAAMTENSPKFQEVSLNAAAEAARMMRNTFDTVAVPWGKVHTLQRGKREVALPGALSGDPVLRASDTRFDEKKWRAESGYGFAMVVSFGANPTAVAMSPFGVSEDPESPHYADQLDLLTGRRFRLTRFLPEEVQRNASVARGCHLCLRSKGTEALFMLNATAPVEARLTLLAQPSSPLPENTLPYSLYLQLEKAPKNTPVDVRMEIHVPEVLCPQGLLNQLAIFGTTSSGDKPENMRWERLEEQQLDEATRTLKAHDTTGSRIYVVLGPMTTRTGRMPIPGEATAPPVHEFTPLDSTKNDSRPDKPRHGLLMTVQKSATDPTPVTIDLNTLDLSQDSLKNDLSAIKSNHADPAPDGDGTSTPAETEQGVESTSPEPVQPDPNVLAPDTIVPGNAALPSPETLQPDIAPQNLPLVPSIKPEDEKMPGTVGRNFNTQLTNKPKALPEKNELKKQDKPGQTKEKKKKHDKKAESPEKSPEPQPETVNP